MKIFEKQRGKILPSTLVWYGNVFSARKASDIVKVIKVPDGRPRNNVRKPVYVPAIFENRRTYIVHIITMQLIIAPGLAEIFGRPGDNWNFRHGLMCARVCAINSAGSFHTLYYIQCRRINGSTSIYMRLFTARNFIKRWFRLFITK